MSNERIDLTQFEKILDGPWSLVDGSEVLVCPTEECLGWCECGKGVPTKGPWIWQYIIGTDIGTGSDLIMATVQQTIDEVMGWGEESNLHEQIANYHLPPKEEGIAYATAKAVQMLPNLIAELKRCYRIIDILQDSEDFDTQVAFHEEGLCKYLKYPCGPCESSEEE
tara:strand:- start:192 stop:692 length:501 start_codon:yes stop_codon:yes gene_type:complete